MRLVSLAKNPVPSGANVIRMIAQDGVALRVVRWEATRGPRRGTVCLFGGRAEFVEKYFEVVADLRRRGFAVATMDWRGQGGSDRLLDDPMKGHVTDFAAYEKDLRQFMREIVMPDCPPPYIALGHSMAGCSLILNAARPGSWFDRMVLTAPMIQLSEHKVRFAQGLARIYASVGVLAGFGRSYVLGGGPVEPDFLRFEGNALTSDRERWQRAVGVLEAAPWLALGSPTIGWLNAAYGAMDRIAGPRFPADVQVPILLFAAAGDEIVSTRAIEDFGVALKVGSTVLLPGSRHEILQENDAIRLRFWAAFDAYMGVSELAA
ncbi:MAG: alpha/beta hydrolase [Hyphomicrobium sp.]|nr:alpha/beta hydrolase [Hyphomicrobium sp.]